MTRVARTVLVACAIGFATSLAAVAQPQPTPQAIPVGTIVAAMQPITAGLSFTGRIEATQRVNVTARVTSFLNEVVFTEGGTVKAGDKLYRLDDSEFNAAVQEARGKLLQAQGAYTNAKLQRERADELVKTAATPVATRDARVADEQNAQGAVIRAAADLAAAELNLSYTEITSPIDGRIGMTAITKGNVVSPSSGTLTTIVSQDPTNVLFPVSQREFLALAERKQDTTGEKARVKVTFSNGTTYPHDGRIDFINVTVNRATDTITVRAVLPNPDGLLVDGSYVQVLVESDKPKEAVLVPQAALVMDQQGVYIFVVKDGKAEVRRLTTAGVIGPNVVVEKGLTGGEQVVVQGLQALRPGAAVIASPVIGG